MATTGILDEIKKWVGLGYPEHTAKKIATGELPMDEASRMARAKEQDFNVNVPLYHWSDVHGINEFKPSQRGKMGSGVYTSPEYEYGRKYTSTENPAVYELLQRGKLAEPTETSHIIEGVRKELFDNPENAGKYSVDDWKRIASERLNAMGYSGRSINDTARNGKDFLPIEQTAFEGKYLRDKNRAAFDPENRESANILGFQGGKPDVSGGLMSAMTTGAGYMPSDDTDYGEDATSAYADVPAEIWNSMSLADKIALVTSPVPVVGGVTGVAADVLNMYNNPEERTGLNAALLASNFIPANKIGGMLGMVADAAKKKTDYRGWHTAPVREGSNSIDDLADIYPDDIYSPKGVQYYGTGEKAMDTKTIDTIKRMQGNPDAEITIYRAVPKGVKDINSGDWVTINKDYAKMHGDSWVEDGSYDIISQKVKAKDIVTNGDSIHEWGYDPVKAK